MNQSLAIRQYFVRHGERSEDEHFRGLVRKECYDEAFEYVMQYPATMSERDRHAWIGADAIVFGSMRVGLNNIIAQSETFSEEK